MVKIQSNNRFVTNLSFETVKIEWQKDIYQQFRKAGLRPCFIYLRGWVGSD